jgi:phospholipid N-methyltransferase
MTATRTPPRARPLRDSLRFLGTFLRHPRRTGAVLPSSRFLARALAKDLAVQPGDLVLEYGPGTGPLTAVLQQRLPPGVQYLGIERDPGFHELLARRFPELPFELGSVEDVGAILAARGLPRPRVILSGLPFASLPAPVQDRIVRGVVDVLLPHGEFRTFQYVHAYGMPAARRFRRVMAGLFPRFRRFGPVLCNVPPAYVLAFGR